MWWFSKFGIFFCILVRSYTCVYYIYICRCYHVRVNRVFVQKVDLYESPSSHEFLKGPNPANQILFPPDGSGSISKLDHPWCLPRKCQQWTAMTQMIYKCWRGFRGSHLMLICHHQLSWQNPCTTWDKWHLTISMGSAPSNGRCLNPKVLLNWHPLAIQLVGFFESTGPSFQPNSFGKKRLEATCQWHRWPRCLRRCGHRLRPPAPPAVMGAVALLLAKVRWNWEDGGCCFVNRNSFHLLGDKNKEVRLVKRYLVINVSKLEKTFVYSLFGVIHHIMNIPTYMQWFGWVHVLPWASSFQQLAGKKMEIKPGLKPGDWTCPNCQANVYASKFLGAKIVQKTRVFLSTKEFQLAMLDVETLCISGFQWIPKTSYRYKTHTKKHTHQLGNGWCFVFMGSNGVNDPCEPPISTYTL